MAVPRFRVDAITPPIVRLAGPEARHALRSLRLGVGDRLRVFDPAGNEAMGSIETIEGDELAVRIVRQAPAAPTGYTLALAVAMPKGARSDWLVEKAVELGVATLSPVVASRSVWTPSAEKLARWRRLCVASAKQSGSAEMGIDPPLPAARLWSEWRPAAARFIADPSGQPLRSLAQAGVESAVAIGPEGGWTAEELTAATDAGFAPMNLGDFVLRIETAAIAVAAAWRCFHASP